MIVVVTFKVGADTVVRTVRLPVIVKLPVTAPPAWTFNELFALANAAVMLLF